jgi:hypothetical protein
MIARYSSLAHRASSATPPPHHFSPKRHPNASPQSKPPSPYSTLTCVYFRQSSTRAPALCCHRLRPHICPFTPLAQATRHQAKTSLHPGWPCLFARAGARAQF